MPVTLIFSQTQFNKVQTNVKYIISFWAFIFKLIVTKIVDFTVKVSRYFVVNQSQDK